MMVTGPSLTITEPSIHLLILSLISLPVAECSWRKWPPEWPPDREWCSLNGIFHSNDFHVTAAVPHFKMLTSYSHA